MPYVQSNNASLHYEEYGIGDPVIAVHGLCENTRYWSQTGVAEALSSSFRVVLMDMRAHGQTTVKSPPWGFDVETAIQDIETVADHLGLSRFHLLSHSTGGFAAVRYAMRDSHRLLSLALTNTASTTSFFPVETEAKVFYEKFAASFEKRDWPEIMEKIKQNPFPFFTGIAGCKDNQAMWNLALDIFKAGDRKAIARFIRSFYTDPDPKIEGLRAIRCPVLVLVGEKDDLFLEPSRLLAREIHDCRLLVYENTGHMTTIEAPERISRDLLVFFKNPYG